MGRRIHETCDKCGTTHESTRWDNDMMGEVGRGHRIVCDKCFELYCEEQGKVLESFEESFFAKTK